MESDKVKAVRDRLAAIKEQAKRGKSFNEEAAKADLSAAMATLFSPNRPSHVEGAPTGSTWANDFVKSHDLANAKMIDPMKDKGKFNAIDAPAKAISLLRNARLDGKGRPEVVMRNGERAPDLIDPKLDEIQKLHDHLYLTHALFKRFGPDEYREAPRQAIKQLDIWKRWMRATEDIRKTTTVLDSTTSGEGDQWVPTGMSSRFIDSVYLELRAASLFPAIDMPTQPFDVPGTTSSPKAFAPAEGVAPSSTTNVVSVKRTLTAYLFKAWTEWTDVLEEDSVFAVVPMLERYMVQATGRAIESAVINGDASSAHGDANFEAAAADAPERTFNGLRMLAYDNSHLANLGGSGSSWSVWATIRAKLGKGFATDTANLAYITGNAGYLATIRKISEVLTMQNFGAEALIKRGIVDMIEGTPIVLSGEFPELLAATGVDTDTSTSIFTGALLVHKPSFATGYRRRVTIETDRTITTGINDLVTSSRFAFVDLQDASALAPLAYGHNMPIT